MSLTSVSSTALMEMTVATMTKIVVGMEVQVVMVCCQPDAKQEQLRSRFLHQLLFSNYNIQEYTDRWSKKANCFACTKYFVGKF